MVRRLPRWIPGIVLGGLWWWAVLRLALTPDAGVFEGAVTFGGWGLSLLPVHALPKGRAAGVAGGSGRHGARWVRARARRAGRDFRTGVRGRGDGGAGRVTMGLRRRRSGGGSGSL